MTSSVELIHKQLLRNRWRYGSLRNAMALRVGGSYAGLLGLRKWFEERHEILTEGYRNAINEDDSIIAGKQQLYDQRPRLHDS
jgi:hypothetical protein